MERTNFAWLFGGLLLLVVLEATPQTGGFATAAALEGAFLALLVLGVWSLRSFRGWFRVALGLVALDLVAVTLYVRGGGLVWYLASGLCVLAFCLLCAALATRFILANREIDWNHLMGASSVYLLLGVIWTVLFAIARLVDPNALTNVTVAPGEPGEVSQLLYFSFVTLTTLGYGDVTPVSPLARNLALLEAVFGQLFVAVLIASLIGRLAWASGAGANESLLPAGSTSDPHPAAKKPTRFP
jgi:hypothetical protein